MRALVQRVSHASVTVNQEIVGIGQGDSEAQVRILAEKIVQLRIFEDEAGKMNRSLLDVQGEMLVVSQFTLYADVRKGRRPNFIRAAHPTVAEPLVELFRESVAGYGVKIASGVFGASMDVRLCNQGPVTIWLDTEEI